MEEIENKEAMINIVRVPVEEEKPCYKYIFELDGTELFSLQAIVNKDNKLCLFNNSNYYGCIPTQFIVTTQNTEYLIKDCTSISEYYSKAYIDFNDLKSKIDQEFVAYILAAKEFDEKIISENRGAGKDELDLGLDEALVYAYIFTHTYPEIHEQIRLFDWENIDNKQLGFLKNCLQPDKITETLNIKLGEEVYLPMIVHEKKNLKKESKKKNLKKKNLKKKNLKKKNLKKMSIVILVLLSQYKRKVILL